MALADLRGGAVRVDYLDFGRGLSLSRQSVGGAQVLQVQGGTLQAETTGLQAIAGNEQTINDDGLDANTRIEGSGEDNLAHFDAGLDTVGIGGAAVSGVQLMIELDTAGTAFHILSLRGNDGAAGGDDDETFFTFYGTNDAGTAVETARISTIYQDVSAAADASQITFDTFVNNALAEVLTIGIPLVGQATAQLMLPAGTALLPNIAAIADPNTGIFLDGSDGLELITGGSVELTLSTTAGTFAGTLASAAYTATAATLPITSSSSEVTAIKDLLRLASASNTEADGDEVIITFHMPDDGAQVQEIGRISMIMSDASAATVRGEFRVQAVDGSGDPAALQELLRVGETNAGALAYGFFGSVATQVNFTNNEGTEDFTLDDSETTLNNQQVLGALINTLISHGIIT